MKRDSKLSGMLHVLLHMAEADGPMTSDALARVMNTNPVVIRRTMAGLREQGFVRSEKGHGGGWRLCCDFRTVTLHDIYQALGSPALLAMSHRTETPGCLVEEAVNIALEHAFQDAEAVLLNRFRTVTLAELSNRFHQRLRARDDGFDPQHAHEA
jgi:DNA-binding IscR family transcriptional regulator